MPLMHFEDWLAEHAGPKSLWYVKRLSANDTQATNSHGAGPYIPKPVIFAALPQLNRPDHHNPDLLLDARIDSHVGRRDVRAVWYNNRVLGTGTRNEARITNWGGQASPLLDPANTGSVAVFAFKIGEPTLHLWICDSGVEEDIVEERLGDISAGQSLVWHPGEIARPVGGPPPCSYDAQTLPIEWQMRFPPAAELVRRSVQLRPLHGRLADERLIARRQCEYGLFQSVENLLVMPGVRVGFATIDDFTSLAQTVLQRRKSRAGLSFEYQARTIFEEEEFVEGRSMSFKPTIENGKEPDFLFPSVDAYNDSEFPQARLRMLGLKTSLRDRWRQVLNEASRISEKHILTLQDSVSEAQYREMREANVRLVVPDGLQEGYPPAVRNELLTLQEFIAQARLL